MTVFSKLEENSRKHEKGIAVLVDPDDAVQHISEVVEQALLNGIDLFLVGGSLVTTGNTQNCVALLKSLGAPRVVLFPGHEIQVVSEADAILFMSLISGRNPEFLIGKQVNAAPWVKKAGLEVIPTGYMLIESGKLTSAVYMSHTIPIPSDKPDIASATAMAGEMLGLKLIYLDAGSGASDAVSEEIICRVSESVNCVVFVGGGIRSSKTAEKAWSAGADIVVVGNGAFENPGMLEELSLMCKKMNTEGIRV